MFGDIVITLALLTAMYSVVMYYKAHTGSEKALERARYGYHITSVLVITASLFFLYIIWTHQYQYKYVFNYSSADLSTGLLLSTFYAGQEGSFLLWLFLAVITGIVLQNYTSKREGEESAVMMVYSLILVFLILMVTPLFQSPFALIWSTPNYINLKYINPAFIKLPALQSYFASDAGSGQSYLHIGPKLIDTLKAAGISVDALIVKGKGLNPLLQNFWMEVHPPILFLGFALSAVPFSFAVASIIKNRFDKWIRYALPWTIAVAVVLGLGLMIGGYWAYGVLGWGGFWGWDPVENASLIPWIISVALLHTLLVQKQTQMFSKIGKFAKTNLLLAALTFLLVIYSTFLTRSGILSDASVHSFGDPGSAVYVFLLVFLMTFTAISLGGILFRRKSLLPESDNSDKILSRESGLLYGSLILSASALVVFVGTSAPILGGSVETSFYNKMNLPLALLMLLLIGFSLFLRWRSTDANEFLRSILPSFIISLAVSVGITLITGIKGASYNLFLFSMVFTVAVNIQILARVMRNGAYFWGGHLAHIGFAVFLFGVLASSTLEQTKEMDLTKGIKDNFQNISMTFTGIKSVGNEDKYSFDINVNHNGDAFVASPVMYFSEYNNSVMREPYIKEGLLNDIYFSPLSYNDKAESASGASPASMQNQGGTHKKTAEVLSVEVSTKPFMSLVWLGVIIMSAGFLLALMRRNKVNKIEGGLG